MIKEKISILLIVILIELSIKYCDATSYKRRAVESNSSSSSSSSSSSEELKNANEDDLKISDLLSDPLSLDFFEDFPRPPLPDEQQQQPLIPISNNNNNNQQQQQQVPQSVNLVLNPLGDQQKVQLPQENFNVVQNQDLVQRIVHQLPENTPEEVRKSIILGLSTIPGVEPPLPPQPESINGNQINDLSLSPTPTSNNEKSINEGKQSNTVTILEMPTPPKSTATIFGRFLQWIGIRSPNPKTVEKSQATKSDKKEQTKGNEKKEKKEKKEKLKKHKDESQTQEIVKSNQRIPAIISPSAPSAQENSHTTHKKNKKKQKKADISPSSESSSTSESSESSESNSESSSESSESDERRKHKRNKHQKRNHHKHEKHGKTDGLEKEMENLHQRLLAI